MSLTQKQLEARATYIGSSDAKTIYESDIYAWQALIDQKRGAKPIKFNKDTQLKVDAGTYMEGFVLDKFSELSEVKIQGYGLEFDKGFYHSTTDAMSMSGHVIEAKTHWGFMDMDELCDMYAPQCQHHMLVTNTKFCWLPVFFGKGARIEYRKINRDEEWINSYIKQAAKFYAWLTEDKQPEDMEFMLPPIWSDTYVTNVKHMDLDEQTLAALNMGGQSIIEAKKATEQSVAAKADFRNLLPEMCRRMEYEMTGNWEGHVIRVTRSKSNTLTVTPVAPKEAKNDNDNE